MISIYPLFAQQQIPIDALPVSWKKMDSATREILVILGAVALVSLLALMSALVLRKRRRQHSRHHRHQHHHHSHSHETGQAAEPESKSEEESSSQAGGERRKHRHRRRRQHRPRNPTLAETGGLPPVRTGRPPDPYP